MGAISTHKIDAKLVAACAAMKKDWSFVFVGGEIRGREVLETCALLENVHLAGHIAYERLPNTMSCFDLLWIPYGLNDYTRHVFPIKIFEYLASPGPRRNPSDHPRGQRLEPMGLPIYTPTGAEWGEIHLARRSTGV